MEFRLLVVAAVLLAGCAGQQPLEPSDPKNKSDNNRFRDSYECEREAAFADAGTKSQVFDNCMKARGYKPK
jgi:hypothetical protein